MERSTEIGVMCSLAMKAALMELAPRFELQSGHPVLAQWVGGVEIAKRLRAGDPSDLVIMAANAIDELAQEGLVAKGSRVDLVRSKIGVAVRSGAPRPDISSGEAVKRAVERARSVAYSSGPSGMYLIEVFKHWKLPEEKLRQAAPGKPSGEFVARGEADICFQQVSELLPVAGIDYIGLLPEDLQLVTVFSAATNVKAGNPEVARALTNFLTSPANVPVLARHGLEPAA
jgi:molybdate transport system substrate-binding protein